MFAGPRLYLLLAGGVAMSVLQCGWQRPRAVRLRRRPNLVSLRSPDFPRDALVNVGLHAEWGG